jgi:hypothetical protein
LLDATSSQNSSQWRNTETVNGANSLELSRSDFDPGRRIVSNGNATSNGINSPKLELVS